MTAGPILRRLASAPDAPPIDDSAAVDRLFHRHRPRILLALTLGYGVAYTCRLALSIVKKPLIDGGVFTAEELGTIGSALFFAYAFAKLTNGFLADHANLKLFFALGVLGSALLNVGMGFSTVLAVSVVLWAWNGWFQGFGAPTAAVALAQWFGTRERGRAYGLWSTSHSIGEGLTFVVVAALVSAWGWRAGFWGPGIACIALAAGLYVFMQDRPPTMGLPPVAVWKGEERAGPRPGGSTWDDQLAVLRRPAVWTLAMASGLVYVTRYAINSWGVLYLQEARGFSLIQAGAVLSVNTVSGIFGSIAYGFVSDNLFGGRRPPANLLFAGLQVAGLIGIFFVPSPSTAFLTVAFFVYGFGLTGVMVSISGLFAIDIVSRRAAGAAMGFVGVFSYLAAAVQERLSGLLIEHGTTVVDGVRRYDFSGAIAFWVGSAVVSAALAATLWRVPSGSE